MLNTLFSYVPFFFFFVICRTIKLKSPQLPSMAVIQTRNILFLLLEIKLIQNLWILEEYALVSINLFIPTLLLFSWCFYLVFFPYFIDQLLILISQHFLPVFPSNFSNCCLLLCSSNTLHFDFILLLCFQQQLSTFLREFVCMPSPLTSTLNVSGHSSSFLTISFALACQDPECMVHRKYFLCWLPPLDKWLVTL